MTASIQSDAQPAAAPTASSIPEIASSTLRALRQLLLHGGYAGTDTTQENAPLKLLKGLFARGEAVERKELDPLFDRALCEELKECGLLYEQESVVRARFQVQSEAGMFFLSDFMRREHPADLVLPIGPSGRHLASLTIRKKIGSALDLGCGCGIQSLLASRHADRVTATDINPRALALTELNAQFNDITNVEILEGSHFEPVSERKFDLIVANLPYVVAPKKKYIYRDSDKPGDQSVREMLLEVPAYLNEGGFAHVVITWIDRAGEPWWALANDMLQCAHTDSWLNHNGSKTPEEYASMWISTNQKQEPEKYANEIRVWTDWYRLQGFHQFGLGSMTLRRRSSGKNWSSAIEIKKFLSNPLGEELAQLFENQDDLENQPDLLKAKLIRRNLEIDLKKQMARTKMGFLLQTKLSGNTIKVVNELGDDLPLGDAIERAAGRRRSSKERDQTLTEVTQLINFGMLSFDKR